MRFCVWPEFLFRQEVLVVVEDAKRKERGRVESREVPRVNNDWRQLQRGEHRPNATNSLRKDIIYCHTSLVTYNQTKLRMGILMLQVMRMFAGGDKAVFMASTFDADSMHQTTMQADNSSSSAAKHAGPGNVGCFCHRMIATARNLLAEQETKSRLGQTRHDRIWLWASNLRWNCFCGQKYGTRD